MRRIPFCSEKTNPTWAARNTLDELAAAGVNWHIRSPLVWALTPWKGELALAPTLALLHTSPTLTPLFTALCRQHMPQTEIFHMVDESLIQQTIAAGKLEKVTVRRVISMVESASLAGA